MFIKMASGTWKGSIVGPLRSPDRTYEQFETSNTCFPLLKDKGMDIGEDDIEFALPLKTLGRSPCLSLNL